MDDVDDLRKKATKIAKEYFNSTYDVDTILDGNYSDSYISAMLNFNGSKTDIREVIGMYQDELKELFRTNFSIRHNIMYDDDAYRHDLDMEDEVNLDEIIDAIFEEKDLDGFKGRAKVAMVSNLMALINTYGMDTLRNNPSLVKEEIEFGIFSLKSEGKTIDYEEIRRIGQKYGKESIVYMQNLEILQQRIDSLFDVASEEMLPELSGLYGAVELCLEAKKDPSSTIELDIDTLKGIYESYEKINRLTIKHLMSSQLPHTISEPTGQLLMVHFIQDIDTVQSDNEMNDFFGKEVLLAAKKMISERTGREYDEERDREQLQEILMQYQESRENPFDLESRLALRCRYTDTHYQEVITKPTTLLSVTISTPEDLKAHLDRKIAIGFLPEDVPIESISATCKFFNSEKDKPDFIKGSHSIADIMTSDKTNSNSNETLVDWTRVKPSYIMVVKDSEEIEPELLARAQALQEKNNLPIVIYDQYALKMNNNKSI
ncbi:MAG: hypothetical protein E7162_05625 [Firmicutes bacterium]|nr:hypothetical protein [Bacillota bacterium]